MQEILCAYVSGEILKWQLTFTDDFYKEIYRLWNLPFIPKYIKNKPSFIGKLTTKYIYEQFPSGIIDRIREKTGKAKKRQLEVQVASIINYRSWLRTTKK